MNGVYSSETLMRDLAKACYVERLWSLKGARRAGSAALWAEVLIPTMLRSFYSL